MIVTENQPDGTPTWLDLGVPDVDRAREFYAAVFGWQFDSPPPEFGGYTTAYVAGHRVAALAPSEPGRLATGGTSTWRPPTATPPPRRSSGPAALCSSRPPT